MKFKSLSIIFASIFILSTSVFAEDETSSNDESTEQKIEQTVEQTQEVKSEIQETKKKPEPEPSTQSFRVGLESGIYSNTISQVSFGFYLGNHFLLEVSSGSNAAKGEKKTGGVLADWQYYEIEPKFNLNFLEFNLFYFFKDVSLRQTGLYAVAGIARSQTKVDFSYTRYKPYNGAICWIGDCSKSVEETVNDSTEFTNYYSKIGFGYTWAFRMKKGAFNLYTGIQYLMFTQHQSKLMGNATRNAVISTDMINPWNANFGINFSFH